MKRSKYWMAGFFVVYAIFLALGDGFVSKAAGTVIYNADDFLSFKGRTKEEIGKRYSEAMYMGQTYENDESESYYKKPCSLTAPYAAGELTEDTHNTMSAMTNFYRYLVGAEQLQNTSVHSEKLQAEALVRNFDFNHMVSSGKKPEDMEQELWDYGAKDYEHNILALYSTPRGAITSWMNEGYSQYSKQWDTLGHRYGLICTTLSDVRFAYSGFCAAGSDYTYANKLKEAFTAFPAPGNMPSELVYAKSSAWSVQLDLSQITILDADDVVAKVTELATGKSYECRKSENTLILRSSVGGAIIGFVQPEPDDGNSYLGSYRVEISGLSDVATGNEAKITYTVDFFNVKEYTPSYVKKVTVDGIREYVVYQTMATTDNLQKISYALPKEVTAITENGREVMVPVRGNWKLDEVNQCWTNQADATSLPDDITDRNHKLKNFSISYKVSDDMYDAYNSLNLYPASVREGDSGKMIVYRTLVTTDTSVIFQLVKKADGTYTGHKKYDSRISPEFDAEESQKDEALHVYSIPSYQLGDAGEYFSIYYSSADDVAYVSTSIRSLAVEKKSSADKEEGKPDLEQESGTEYSLPNSSQTNVFVSQSNIGQSDTAQVGQTQSQVKPPARVVVKKKKKKSGSVHFTFRKMKVAGYQVVYAKNKAFKKAVKKTTKKNTFTLKRKKGKKYYIRVRAFVYGTSGKRVYGKFSKVVKV